MRKVFLFLYPIKEYISFYQFRKDSLYDELGIERPLPILNRTIDKRYREKGYEVVFALYPDRELFGIDKKEKDKIIYTDILFKDASAYDEKGRIKKDFIPKYPSEEYLLNQIGNIDELIVGGYHAMDCVKRVAEYAMNIGINSLVDLDLTELFFGLYKQKDYFNEEYYDIEKFKNNAITRYGYNEIEERQFNKTYSSEVYGFQNINIKKR